MKDIKNETTDSRVNILLEGYDIDAPWLRGPLQKYIAPGSSVVIIAFAFRDDCVQNADDWDLFYGRTKGCYYNGIINSFRAYGVKEDNISFINYFKDSGASAAEKIGNADILYFPGGLPDRMMDRIREFGIYDEILRHKGVILGYSAGAVIQLREYHLSPDDDYPAFSYYEGFPFLEDFYLEVHYENTDVQNESIRRVLKERNKPVYATEMFSGAIIVDNSEMTAVGKVKKFV